MPNDVTAIPETLMRQAWMTADEYLRYAIECIDLRFNTVGYAKEHPELVAAFMNTAARDFHTGMMAKTLGYIGDTISEVATMIGDIDLNNNSTQE